MMVAAGTNSCSSSSRFASSSTFKRGHAREVAARPVRGWRQAQPRPGRPRSRRRSESSWSPPLPPVPPATRARQSRSPDGEPDRPPMPAIDRIDPPPSGIRSLRSGPRHSRFRSGLGGTRPGCVAYWPGAVVLRNPITGIAGCCARAASGHATAAPPRSVMNSRRFIRSPRRRARAVWQECRGRVSWRS